MRSKVIFIAVAGVVSMTAAWAYAQHAAPGSRELGQVISVRAAHAKAVAGEVVLVDIRTPAEWRETGVPAPAKAIMMREGNKAFHAELAIALGNDRTRPIALICRTGNRTTRIQAELRQAGFTNILNVAEGVAGGPHGIGWVKSGLPVTRVSRP